MPREEHGLRLQKSNVGSSIQNVYSNFIVPTRPFLIGDYTDRFNQTA